MTNSVLVYQVRGGYLGSLTVRMTFYLRRAGLAAKHYEHIGLVWTVTPGRRTACLVLPKVHLRVTGCLPNAGNM